MANQKPSLTAFLIPKIIPALAGVKRYKPLVTRQQVNISKRFANECAKHDFTIRLLHTLIRGRMAIWMADNLSVKGLSLHLAVRKKYIREKLDDAIAEVKQVVMIGAGFDTLCIEYQSQHPNIEFFELDQISTQQTKISALSKIPQYDRTPNLHFISCDLSKQALGEVLKAHKNYDKKARTFFVIEGVLMYLKKTDVEKLFQEISAAAPSGSQMVFGSISELKPKKDGRSKISDAALAASKETYSFAATGDEIKKMLGRAGFELKETKLYHELQKDIESAAQIAAIKRERGEHYYYAIKS